MNINQNNSAMILSLLGDRSGKSRNCNGFATMVKLAVLLATAFPAIPKGLNLAQRLYWWGSTFSPVFVASSERFLFIRTGRKLSRPTFVNCTLVYYVVMDGPWLKPIKQLCLYVSRRYCSMCLCPDDTAVRVGFQTILLPVWASTW